MRRRILVPFVGVALLLTSIQPVWSEAPSWEEREKDVLLIRRHALPRSDFIIDPSTDGIWLLTPDDEIRRLRPFSATFNSGAAQRDDFGEAGFLTIAGDRLLFQGWPAEIHFDAFSWRMVNRLSISEGLRAGWALQGPHLDPEEVRGSGLESGVYGIARCLLRELSSSHGGAWFTDCTSITMPGSGESTVDTQVDWLLYQADSPGWVEDAAAIHAFPDNYGGTDVLLSFDPDQHAFWRGTAQGAQLFPVEDGELQDSIFDLDLSLLSFGIEESTLTMLYYHPGRHRLYGNLRALPYTTTERDNVFFSIDPISGEAHDLTDIFEDDIWPPVTLTSFGPTPENYEQIIPIIADTPGENGAYWTTDLWLYNPASTAVTVTLTGLMNSTVKKVDLGAHSSIRLENVLAQMSGEPGGNDIQHDALFVSSPYRWAEQVVAVGRIWTTDPGTGGSYGHVVTALPAPYGFSNHSYSDDDQEELYHYGGNRQESHIDLDLRTPGRFRHNIGIVNTSHEEVTIELGWNYKDGAATFAGGFATPHRHEIVVPPRTIRVLGIEDLFSPEVVQGWPPRIGVFSEKPAIVWMSMVDNLTGDATFVPFTNFSANAPIYRSTTNPPPFNEYRLAVPVVAHTDGIGPSHWQTDLFGYLMATSGTFADPTPFVAYHPVEPGACDAPAGNEISDFLNGVLGMPVENWRNTRRFPPEEDYRYADPFVTIFPDVVHLLTECEGAQQTRGGLEIVTGSWFSGFTRTYTTRSDGGTYGAMLPLYPPNGWPVQHFAGLELNEQTRINIGFFNGDHDHAIIHKVTLYAENGSQVAQRSFILESLASKQMEIHSLFSNAELPPGTYGLTVLPLDQEAVDEDPGFQGHSWAYVSVIDNLTNDPINLW